MSWSLDWFSAADAARKGQRVRRVGWTDRWLTYWHGLWWTVKATESHVVLTSEFGVEEFTARDWTTEPIAADICGAAPSNTTPPVYRLWTDEPIFAPPPVPGFPDTHP